MINERKINEYHYELIKSLSEEEVVQRDKERLKRVMKLGSKYKCVKNEKHKDKEVKKMAWLTGYPREKVKWYPTIDLSKCVKCGMCMNCGKNVYEWTKDGPRVVRPFQCVVGCSTCGNLCLGNAITFPDIQEVREIYKKHGIWAKVKKQLIEEGKIQDSSTGEE